MHSVHHQYDISLWGVLIFTKSQFPNVLKMSPVVSLDLSLDTGVDFWIPVPFSLLNTAFLLPKPSTEFSLAPEAACFVVFPFDKVVSDSARAGTAIGANDA